MITRVVIIASPPRWNQAYFLHGADILWLELAVAVQPVTRRLSGVDMSVADSGEVRITRQG
jgi:hypothetical protein